MKPIIFNTEMVKAILDGRKTQTRRVVGDKLLNEIYKNDCYIDDGQIFEICMCQGMPDGSGGYEVDRWEEDVTTTYSKYKIGDILYVRETWTLGKKFTIKPENVWYIRNDLGNEVYYKADLNDNFYDPDNICKWKPSIHMPKKYARIFLKVTNVRVERLQDMKIEDFLEEGIRDNGFIVKEPENGLNECYKYLKEKWISLWNSTAKDGYKWEDDPFVFVYEFERVYDV